LFELVLRIGFSLLIILGMMWGLARLVRRPLTGRGHGPLVVLDRQQLSRGAAVTVVKVADRAMILGVTDQQVSLLGETEIEFFEHHPVEHRDHVDLDEDLPGGPADLPSRHPAAHQPGRLEGSLLSPRTWRSAMDFLRDRTSHR